MAGARVRDHQPRQRVPLSRIAKTIPHMFDAAIAADGEASAGVRGHFRPGMAWLLAWRNLVNDRVRFAATLVGIAFAVVLMAVQWGLLIGFANTASGLINHAG